MERVADGVLDASPWLVCALVAAVVFDAVPVALMAGLVVVAAVAGDSVGYEVGRRLGPRLLAVRVLQRHGERIGAVEEVIARRGGVAVFLGRSVAFARAVTPALAGAAHMPYRTFLPWNAVGGLVWGTGAVVLGFIAGNSWERVAREAGTDVAVVVGVVVVVALLVAWRVRRRWS